MKPERGPQFYRAGSEGGAGRRYRSESSIPVLVELAELWVSGYALTSQDFKEVCRRFGVPDSYAGNIVSDIKIDRIQDETGIPIRRSKAGKSVFYTDSRIPLELTSFALVNRQ